MTDTKMDRVFAHAVREELIHGVTKPSRIRHRRRWIGLGIVVGFGVLAGGGTAIAASIWGVPGTPQQTTLIPPEHFTETGTATVVLSAAPAHTNDVQLSLVCLSPGSFTFSDGASVECGPSDIGASSAVSTYDLPAKPGQTSVTITASPGAHWSLTAGWTIKTTTPWGTNGRGQTYGAQNSNGTPDLIAAVATNGKTGYVFAKQLADADGDTAAQHFTSPAQALAWQKVHAGKTTVIPVYESDGTTQIGVFNVGS
ncbi:MAG TPA: peptidase M56 family protein [Galbitalea sp.]